MELISKEAEIVNLAIATPYYRTMPTKTHYCLMQLLQALPRANIDFKFYGVDLTYLPHARTNLARKFMGDQKKLKFDWIMHIDSDQVFNPKDVLNLIQDAEAIDCDILSGVYFTKERHICMPLALTKNPENKTGLRRGHYTYMMELPKPAFFEADAIGLGFMLCRPTVYEALIKEFDWDLFEYKRSEPGQGLGEDIVWCEKVKSLGYKIMLDNNVKIGHMGGEVGYEEYLAYRAKIDGRLKE